MARDQGADEAREYEPGQPGMYELEFPAPQLSSSDGRGPVLVHALEGFSDAGHAIRLAAAHLKAALDTELVASFAIDELLDYRSRRPLMTFKTDHFTHSDDPELSLYALRDSIGTPFLLLAGLEPDLKWERFITAVRLLAERLGVRQTIGLGTVPMAVPHTRPITMTAHSNNRELISDFQPSISEIQVPGSASNLLEYRMAQHGHEVVGFTVHVPHYLTQTDYPAAAQALLEQVAKTGSLQLPLAALAEAAAEVQAKIDEQVQASAEVAQVVAALERQYDAFIDAQENRSFTVHGYRRAFRIAGSGPAILLIHGIGDNSTTWNGVHAKLAQRFTVIAPDLLGHGQSDKPRADYSVAAYANGMRDLLSVLDIERVTIVGHSLGGGVAMQFAYQFPQLVDRLILVSAGGVTKDVNIVFRLASLPMGSEAMALLRLPLVLPAVQIAGRIVGKAIGTTSLGHDLPNVLRILDDLPEPTASAAFGRTLRAVVDWRGQMVTMLDRCYLTEAIPVQIIWGTKDVVLPVRHAHMAHAAMPGSQLEIFEGSGHFPFHDDPARFIDIVERFMDTTEPAEYDQAALRALLRRGGGEATVTGSADTRVAVLNAIGSNERSAT